MMWWEDGVSLLALLSSGHLSGSDPLASGFRPGPQGYGQDGV